jgi:hypothetical protein
MVLKKEKSKKLKKQPPKKPKQRRSSLLGKVVVLDGKREIDKRTGMNRDIPMGGAGGSSNLMANLTRQGLAVGPPQPSIQTPDQFKLAQDISSIRSQQADIKKEQSGIAEQIGIQRKERSTFFLADEEKQKTLDPQRERLSELVEQEKQKALDPQRVRLSDLSRIRQDQSNKGKVRGPKINIQTEAMDSEAIPTGADEFVLMPTSAGGKAKPRASRQKAPLQGQVAMTQPPAQIPSPIPYPSNQAPLAPQPSAFSASLVGEDGGGMDEIMGDGLGQPTM